MDLQPDMKHKQPSHVVSAMPPMRQHKISSDALLGRRGELIIEHGGREYRLRLTQNGKLILTA
ncbi:MAG: hemin uptake protein HemP [Betaproteobacteria bacterium]|nr:hemin uptake protein HemP [Betaproteobacteria bacterium]